MLDRTLLAAEREARRAHANDARGSSMASSVASSVADDAESAALYRKASPLPSPVVSTSLVPAMNLMVSTLLGLG